VKWQKKGLICSHQTIDLPWYKKNTMVPVPYLIDGNRLRIYITMCDSENIGRIGYVDVNPNNPSDIIGFSEEPCVDLGDDGCFDDNGVVTASILKDGEVVYLYYSGYQTCVKVPYMIFTGVAISHDNGNSFTKITKRVPLLDRVEGESATRCAPFVLVDGSEYKMWYTADSGNGWIDYKNKKLPLYDLKYIKSSSPLKWQSERGKTCLSFQDDDEHGIAKCTLWKDNDIYKIIYSIRSRSEGYRLGYAESTDGECFVRKDSEVGISVSDSGWDSEMIAFAERFEFKDKVYLFYCGNHYGMEGMGYAELVEN
jgi:hypothetical protein